MTARPALAVMMLSDSFASVWADVAQELDAELACLTPDDDPPAHAVAAVLAAEGIDRVHPVGQSMGGWGGTAFTKILLVAPPQVAVANGDHALATTFLSIQSDEARHMANGYGSIMAVLEDENNVPALNRALERHFWHSHKALDALVGWQAEYGATVRPWSY